MNKFYSLTFIGPKNMKIEKFKWFSTSPITVCHQNENDLCEELIQASHVPILIKVINFFNLT